ncbi:tetraspanin-8 [Setaria italica]|uniref:tetraspanin-8 n=1 Tax=Setaria italica TaxID=4555 RepID=UPI000BE5227E|nr:tetraspanin-8 [Setaria italica]
MAARLSHGLLGALNVVTLLLSLPVLCAGVYFRMRAATECERALQLPVVAFGCALRGAASGRHGYREYRLGDYSGWLQAQVAAPETWRRVESCLSEARVCGVRPFDGAVGRDAMEFYKQHLSPIQSGCCKPPTRCGFRHVNATFWAAPKSGSSPSAAPAGDGDCRAWSNDVQVLCFECEACKAGVLETVKTKWKAVAIVNVALLVLLIVVYTLGCCALRGNGGSRYSKRCGADET